MELIHTFITRYPSQSIATNSEFNLNFQPNPIAKPITSTISSPTMSTNLNSTHQNINPKSNSDLSFILPNPFYPPGSSPSTSSNLILSNANLIENSNLIYENCKNLINGHLSDLDLEQLSNPSFHQINTTINNPNQFFEFNSNLNLLNDSSIPRQVNPNSLMNYSNEFYNVEQDPNTTNLTNLSFLNSGCFDPLMSTTTNDGNQQTPTTMSFLTTDPLSPIVEEGIMTSPNGVGTGADWNSFGGGGGGGGSSSPVSIDEHLLQQQQQQQTPEGRGSLYFFSSSPSQRQENENEIDEQFYQSLNSNQSQEFLRISTSSDPTHELNRTHQQSINPIELIHDQRNHSSTNTTIHQSNLDGIFANHHHEFLSDSLNRNWWEENQCPPSPSHIGLQTQSNSSTSLIEHPRKSKGILEKRYRTDSQEDKPNVKRMKVSTSSSSQDSKPIKQFEVSNLHLTPTELNYDLMPTKRSRGRRPPVSPEVGLPMSIDGNLDLKKLGMQSVPGGQAFDPSLNPNSDVVKFCELTKTGKPKKIFVCQVRGCGKCFKRSEHLKRHVRSIHTNHKPYKCPWLTCNKSFSRHDNLNQHLRVHRLEEGGERLNGLHVCSDGLIRSDLGEINVDPLEIGLKNVEIEVCSIGF